MAPLLTSAPDALAATAAVAAVDGVVVVLSEDVVWVDDDGRQVRAHHEIRRATSAAGAASLGRLSFPFTPREQSLHLALARTLQPDGTAVPIGEGAAAVQTPQTAGDTALAAGAAELAIDFPQLQAGSAVEFIAVVAETAGPIPDELTGLLTFASSAPAARVRWVIDAPDALARRLQLTPVGDVPEAVRAAARGGRTRFTWEARDVPALADEPARPPLRHQGPAVWLSTLPSWEALADGYRGLLAGSDALSPELATQVDAWTAGAVSRSEVIEALHRQVADEIRTVAGELTAGILRPRPPDEVWRERSGTAVDKVNLLRVCLRHKGIDAFLTLLDTTHAGRIETRSPDYRHFDHAILSVDRGDGRYLYSDPAIPFLPAGRLAPHDGDRQALVVRTRGYQFVQTPAAPAGVVELDFDLALAAAGGLEGGVTLAADGYRGAVERARFTALERGQALAELGRDVGGFFPGAEVSDVDLSGVDLAGGDGKFVVRGAFTAPVSSDTDAGALTLPNGCGLDVGPGPDPPRQTPFYRPLTSTRLRLRYSLPEGWSADVLPAPFDVSDAAFAAAAAWRAEDGAVSATLSCEQRQALVPAARYASFAQAQRALVEWLRQPARAAPASAPARLEAARREERRGRIDSALALYERLAASPPSPAACDGVLRSVFLLLERGERDRALAQMSFLGGLGPAEVARCASPFQAAGLGALAAEPEYARRFWQAQDGWWPSWQALEEDLELPASGAGPVVPVVGALDQLGAEMGQALQAQDRRRFFALWRLALHAARWQPGMVREVSSLGGLATRMAPELAGRIRELVVQLNQAPLRDPELIRASQLFLVANLIDLNEPAKALAVARQYFVHDQPRDVVHRRMVTLRGYCAGLTGEDLDVATAGVEQLLDAGEGDDNRQMVTAVLAQLYRRQGRTRDEMELLAQELARPALDSEQRQALDRRVDELRQRASDDETFGAAFARWLAAHRPPWFDATRPLDLTGLPLPVVGAAISPENGRFGNREKAKIALLAAADPRLSAAQRAAVFLQALRLLRDLAPSFDERRKMFQAVADDDGFSTDVRRDAHFLLVAAAFDARDAEAFRAALEHPLYAAAYLPAQRESVAVLRSALGVPVDSPPRLADHVFRLLARPLNRAEQALVAEFFNRLLELGAFDLAQTLTDAMAAMRLAGGDARAAATQRFEYLRRLQGARAAAAKSAEANR